MSRQGQSPGVCILPWQFAVSQHRLLLRHAFSLRGHLLERLLKSTHRQPLQRPRESPGTGYDTSLIHDQVLCDLDQHLLCPLGPLSHRVLPPVRDNIHRLLRVGPGCRDSRPSVSLPFFQSPLIHRTQGGLKFLSRGPVCSAPTKTRPSRMGGVEEGKGDPCGKQHLFP